MTFPCYVLVTRVAVYDMVDNSLFILLVCDIIYYCLHLSSIFLFCFILGSSLFSLYNPLFCSLRSTVYTQSSFVSSSYFSLDLVAVMIHTFIVRLYKKLILDYGKKNQSWNPRRARFFPDERSLVSTAKNLILKI
jgi:hypothetical protein